MFKKLLYFLISTFCLTLPMLAIADKEAHRGTPEEAVAMVKKAIEYIKTNGREKAYAEINNPNGNFINGDLYVIVFDLNGKTMANGWNQRFIGKVALEMKDADGKQFVKEKVALAKAVGYGWVDYRFNDPITKELEPKTAYIERLDDLIVTCGVYKH